ncbi:MAG: S-methyl-5-thioribose-1-phosphate isomerase [Gemmatimonadaceae bacterium]|nr:S-methyl-5-thioribose-1-phosphate isomerase [Gemmatimonadaceae bacterium]
MTSPIEAVRWSPDGRAVRIIDQTLLPGAYRERDLHSLDDVVRAIQSLAVRGAPAIGVCGAMGLAVVAQSHAALEGAAFRAALASAARVISAARPTAVNLSWAVDRLMRVAHGSNGSTSSLLDALRDEATRILDEDRAMCRAIGEHGASLLGDGARVLTHCNAGALATGGMGTALAPVYVAKESGRRVAVFADETRPLLQGSRLTAWELARAGIPVTILADNMAASVMRAGTIDLCIVGADRIAANGDVANKIGTYGVAVLARHHGIPFYVAAPSSTIDPATPTGAQITIEQRSPDEITRGFGSVTAPDGVGVYNPAFDITPAELVTAIITERGIHHPPYRWT